MRGARGAESLTQSPTADTPTGDPLDSLPLRQLFVFIARARRRSLSEVARVLHVSRFTVHEDLQAAMAQLAATAKPPVEAKARGRAYDCPEHRYRCAKGCRYLRDWLREFDASQPRDR